MKIESIRVYSEVLEQGIDFKEYIREIGYVGPICNSYTKKSRDEFTDEDSLVDKIRKAKDVDVLITTISGGCEYPLVMVEYSTAVPTDDHKMQRSDVYYWSSVFHCPMMKISPSCKGMGQDFGGGSKFTDEYEQIVSYRKGAIFYPVLWNSNEGTDTLPTKNNACSCIYHCDEILTILRNLMTTFAQSITYNDYYSALRESYAKEYADVLTLYTDAELKAFITDSTRFEWINNKLKVKINRFGHAMDPDRGVLYFVNMLVGVDNVITEIQINRPPVYDARGGYKSLFDALSCADELKQYVLEKIKNDDNVFTSEDALYILKTALNISSLIITKQSSKEYVIDDNNLLAFLETHPAMVSKSIFMLSTELLLTDVNRNVICKITWNRQPVDQYLAEIANANYRIIPLKRLSIETAKEDIITYASVELYKKMQCGLLAASYPGAQGDRCILTGSGRNILRTYIDIIAYKDSENKLKVFLQENKDSFSKSADDVKKLNKVINDPEYIKGLEDLFRKTIDSNDLSEIFISVGAKAMPNIPALDVDYIFMFDIDSSNRNQTKVNYTVGLINTTLLEDFKPLMNEDNCLKGTLELDPLYIIDSSARIVPIVKERETTIYEINIPEQLKVAEDVVEYNVKK